MATRIPALIQLSDPRVAAQLVYSKIAFRWKYHRGLLLEISSLEISSRATKLRQSHTITKSVFMERLPYSEFVTLIFIS